MHQQHLLGQPESQALGSSDQVRTRLVQSCTPARGRTPDLTLDTRASLHQRVLSVRLTQDVNEKMVAALDGPMMVRKGKRDAICTTEYVVEGPAEGSPRRAGGQVRLPPGQDVLSSVAAAC